MLHWIFEKKLLFISYNSKLLGLVAIDSGSECMDLMWIKNINFEKEKKRNLTGYISNNDNYTIEFF